MTVRPLQRVTRWTLVISTALAFALALLFDQHGTGAALLLVPTLGYALVGLVVSTRRPGNAIGWIFLWVGLLGGLIYLGNIGTEAALADGPPVAWWGVLAAWTYSIVWFPAMMLITTFTLLLFPSGLPSPRWRPILWVAAGSSATVTLLLALAPTIDVGDETDPRAFRMDNPFSPSWASGGGDLGTPWWVDVILAAAVLCAIASVGALVLRTWRSRGVERQQMGMFAFAVSLFLVQLILSGMTGGFGNPTIDGLTFTAVMTCIPVACGLAILRYRLYDIDRLISRTTSYAIVTGVLVAVYAAVVTSVTRLLPGSSSTFAVAAATLLAAALFRPLLTMVQRLVDRRFNRSRYDAHRTVEAFAARLRDEVTPEAVTSDLLDVLARTVEPDRAVLWIRTGVS